MTTTAQAANAPAGESYSTLSTFNSPTLQGKCPKRRFSTLGFLAVTPANEIPQIIGEKKGAKLYM
jgi:hypothetical protein